MPGIVKYFLLIGLLVFAGTADAQPVQYHGYTLYDCLVTANHPNGCSEDYVTGMPDDSTWVNMSDFSVMTGYFGQVWQDLPGKDLLLESSFHLDNYSVRLIKEGGGLSAPFVVQENMWTVLPFVNWTHLFTGCIPGMAASPVNLFAIDFEDFGVFPGENIIGIEITFLPTVGQADFAGAYIIVPPCGLFSLGPDVTLCPGETINIDATTLNATYHWQDGSINPVFSGAGPGLYWVDVTIFDCSKRDTIIITEHPGPPSPGNDTTLCAGESMLLDVTTPGATYVWQNNTTSSTFLVSQPGDYAVTVTIDNCVYTEEIHADYVVPADIHLGNDTTLCEGDVLLLNAAFPGATYLWQDFSGNSTYTVQVPGHYAVTVDVSGCISSEEIDVDYVFPPQVDLGGDAFLCAGESLLLDAYLDGGTYLWQDQSTNSSYAVTQTGTYAVTVTIGQCTTTDVVEINFIPAIDIDLGHDTLLCSGATILLDASTPNATYSWQDHSTGATLEVSSPGQYIVNVTVESCSVYDTINIGFINPATLTLGNDTTLCPGESLLLDAFVIGATYLWQDQTTADTLLVTSPGQYNVLANVNGCSIADTINVDYSSLLPPMLGNDTTLCSGETLLLAGGNAGATYVWQDLSTESTFVVDQPGEYWVSATINQCSASDTIHISYDMVDPVDLGHDTILCDGEELLLMVDVQSGSPEWQDHSTSHDFLVTEAGDYWVKIQNGHCSISDTIHVDYISLLSIDLGRDTTLCGQESLLLEPALSGVQYLWQDLSANSFYQVTEPGVYWVKVSAGNCEVSDTVHVDYIILPLPDLGNDTFLCTGQSLGLGVNIPGASYLWQDLSVEPTMNVTQPGIYWVIATNGICSVSDTIAVSDHPSPSVDLGPDTTLCAGETLLLLADVPGTTVQWQDHSIQTSYIVNASGQYAVTVDDGLCMASDTIQVVYLDVSAIQLGRDTILCAGQTLILQANAPGANYLWQDLSSAASFAVTEAGRYWVEASFGGCTASDTIEVGYQAPIPLELGEDTLLCPGETITLYVSVPGAAYTWQDQSTESRYTVTQQGTYTVTASLMGCDASDSVYVGYIALPVIDLGPDTVLCTGETLLLDATYSGATYSWQDLSASPTYSVIQAGIYVVDLQIDKCVVTDSISIDYFDSFRVDLGGNRSLCEGASTLLDPEITGAVEYEWQDLSAEPTLTVSAAGVYWLTVRDRCGIRSDTITVEVESCSCRLFFPNSFTPNGDGINDVFQANASCMPSSFTLKIFDRAGGLLFQTKNISEGWDGRAGSREAQSGVYVYLAEYSFENQESRISGGDVTLMR